MKRSTRMVMLACCLLAVSGLAMPYTFATRIASAAQEMSAQNVTINGKVSAVTDTSVTVVDSEKMEQTVSIDAKTKITKSGKAAKAADIKANDNVVVVATKGDGKALTAVSIEVG